MKLANSVIAWWAEGQRRVLACKVFFFFVLACYCGKQAVLGIWLRKVKCINQKWKKKRLFGQRRKPSVLWAFSVLLDVNHISWSVFRMTTPLPLGLISSSWVNYLSFVSPELLKLCSAAVPQLTWFCITSQRNTTLRAAYSVQIKTALH